MLGARERVHDDQALLDRGGNGFLRRALSPVVLPETAAGAGVFRLPLAAAACCRPPRIALLEGLEHPLVEITAVIIGNLPVADTFDDVIQLFLQAGAALRG